MQPLRKIQYFPEEFRDEANNSGYEANNTGNR